MDGNTTYAVNVFANGAFGVSPYPTGGRSCYSFLGVNQYYYCCKISSQDPTQVVPTPAKGIPAKDKPGVTVSSDKGVPEQWRKYGRVNIIDEREREVLLLTDAKSA